MEAPDGRGVGDTPDRLGDFSPGLPRPPILRRLGFVPMFQGTCPGRPKRHSRPPASASRSTTPESRIGRRTCALPMLSGEISMGRLNKVGTDWSRESLACCNRLGLIAIARA